MLGRLPITISNPVSPSSFRWTSQRAANPARVKATRARAPAARDGLLIFIFAASLSNSFVAELLVHGKATEVSASAFDALFGVELETVAVEE